MKMQIDGFFVLVESSKLSLDDEFMQHQPRTRKERKFKEQLAEVIQKGVKDFYCSQYDPSFRADGAEICFVEGKYPAVGRSYNWWNSVAKLFAPEYKSRLGTRTQYVAFLGVLIKTLVTNGWSVEDAWDAVCEDSTELGHYRNSDNATRTFEVTGSREICGFFDLANTYKIVSEDTDTGGFWLAGGDYYYNGFDFPLAMLYHTTCCREDQCSSVGWIVLEM